jgi:hypothetical protein
MCTILEEEGDSFDIDNVPTKKDNINTKSRRYKMQTSAKNCLATPAKALKLPNRL